jgi:ABC-type phosphate transport system permease subunit
MMSIPSYDSALMLAGLFLFIIVSVFSVAAALLLTRIKRGFALG